MADEIVLTEESGTSAPIGTALHLTAMRIFALIALVAVGMAGCTPHDRSPDAIREQTAHATSTAVRDAKAITQGVVQGIRQQRTININKGSVKDLTSLPGIDDATAGRIIEHRPYGDSYDLVKKRVISKAEYNRIAGKDRSALNCNLAVAYSVPVLRGDVEQIAMRGGQISRHSSIPLGAKSLYLFALRGSR